MFWMRFPWRYFTFEFTPCVKGLFLSVLSHLSLPPLLPLLPPPLPPPSPTSSPLCQNNIVAAPAATAKYASDKDQITLEDQSGRIDLEGSLIHEDTLVTGTRMTAC